MGKMKIAIHAERDGKRFQTSFTCEFDDKEIDKTRQFIQAAADDAAVTPEEFAQSTLYQLTNTGWLKDSGARQAQTMAISYIVLHLPTGDPSRMPGAVYNYAPDLEISVLLKLSDRGMKANIDGRDVL